MASFNKITICGYLGRDPELRYTPSGDAVCTFSVATTERGKKEGEDGVTTWFRITTWRRQAEVANQYLAKGKLVYIEGRLKTNEFTDRDGNARTSLEVTCTDMQFLSTQRADESPAPTAQADAEPEAETPKARKVTKKGKASGKVSDEGVMDDDIPF